MRRARTAPADQRGMVLVASLLLLLVVTIMAVSLFRSFGIDEKIAGNTREKQVALAAAETAEQYAEQWLSNTPVTAINCTQPLVAPLSQACTNLLPDFTNLPWYSNGNPAGVTWQPGGNAQYAQAPAYYISLLGAGTAPDGITPGTVYQIDAAGYGNVPGAKAVVESTFIVVNCTVLNVGNQEPCN
jgi:type IV pilus assembly protein PilX